jgi:hypothetical protein
VGTRRVTGLRNIRILPHISLRFLRETSSSALHILATMHAATRHEGCITSSSRSVVTNVIFEADSP